MIVIGLTGGIASGKSTVAAMLTQKGAHLLDADRLAREAVEPGRPAWREIVDWLGESILLPDRTIDRPRLAALVFKDRRKLDKLNSIVHPWVGSRFQELSREIKEQHPRGVLVYDVPLLVEAGLEKSVDLVLLVYVTREIQLERLQKRDGLTRAVAERRLQSQLPLEEKRRLADYIIDNSGSRTETGRQVDIFWQQLIEPS